MLRPKKRVYKLKDVAPFQRFEERGAIAAVSQEYYARIYQAAYGKVLSAGGERQPDLSLKFLRTGCTALQSRDPRPDGKPCPPTRRPSA